MFLNSSSNHFNISSFLQQNKFTLIPLATNYLLFPHSTPGAHGIKAQEFLEAVQAHGQYSQNNSKDDGSLQFHMEPKSYGMNDSESHNAEPIIYRKLPGTPMIRHRILKITQLMTDHPHSTWNTSHIPQMTQKVTMQNNYL